MPTTKNLMVKHMRSTSLFHFQLLLFIFTLFNSFALTEGKRKTSKQKKGRRVDSSVDAQDRMYSTFRLVRNTYMLVLLPVVIFFFWSLYKDPAVPQIAKAVWLIAKKKLNSHLGKKEEDNIKKYY